ncbi:MAG: TRAP transporter substrate-binding protein [candidate division NC10 bacterium]|nr:TRAP transporter substrate-binding protein [candidate division NC10 bacterium]
MKRVGAVSLLLVVGLALGASEGSAQSKVVLKAGHTSSLIYQHHIGLLKMNEVIKSRTNGQVEIQVFPMSQLGNERDLVEGIQLGTIDMIAVSNAMVSNFVPEAIVFDLPYLFKDQDHALRTLLSPAGQRVMRGVEQKVGKILAYYATGVRSVFNRVRPVRTPDDLKGLKIRVIQNKIYLGTINAMGGIGTPLPFSEVYGALQQGVIDGAENSPVSLLGMKHYEHSKYYTLTNHFVLSGYVLMNWNRWRSFTPEQQKIIAEAAQLSQKMEYEYEKEEDIKSLVKLRELGVQIIEDVNRGPFEERAKAVWREVPEHASLVEEIRKVK